jgi:hypothetical protein
MLKKALTVALKSEIIHEQFIQYKPFGYCCPSTVRTVISKRLDIAVHLNIAVHVSIIHALLGFRIPPLWISDSFLWIPDSTP